MWSSLVAQMVKNLPPVRETWVWSLGWEDRLEETAATHSSILAWRIPMDRGAWQPSEEPDSPWGCRELDRTEQLSTAHTHSWHKGEESICQCGRPKRWGFDLRVQKIPWRRKRQPTAVFLSGKSHRQRSLAGYSPWDHQESDTTEHSVYVHALINVYAYMYKHVHLHIYMRNHTWETFV